MCFYFLDEGDSAAFAATTVWKQNKVITVDCTYRNKIFTLISPLFSDQRGNL